MSMTTLGSRMEKIKGAHSSDGHPPMSFLGDKRRVLIRYDVIVPDAQYDDW